MKKNKIKENIKKSETIEFRLSYEEKLSLQERAKFENRSVSDVLRGLIHAYLAKETSSAFFKHVLEMMMKTKTIFLKSPKAILALIITIVTTTSIFMSTAFAQVITLDVSAEIVKTIEEGTRTSRFAYNLEVGLGESMIFEVNVRGKPYILSVLVTENNDLAVLELALSDDSGEVVAKPVLTTEYGSLATFFIRNEGEETFEFKVLPQIKT